jgi:hypothetical protein
MFIEDKMNTNALKLITLILLLGVSLSATVLKQQSFEGAPTDTWGYTTNPTPYTNNNDIIWNVDNDFSYSGLPDNIEPLPDGSFVWNAEQTSGVPDNPGTCTLTFDTIDLGLYSGDLSLVFYYYAYYVGKTTGWEGSNDVLNYSIQYDNGSWNSSVSLATNKTAWTKITILIPSASTHVRLRFEVENNKWQEIAAFDLITLETTDPASPITLADFSAFALHSGIEVSWATASEKENSGFKLYRDGEMIAFIDGAGTSTETNEYSYLDKTVVPGQSYTYMLADVSYGGVENTFENDAVTIHANAASTLNTNFILESAYPNPFNPSTTLAFSLLETQDIDLAIFNMKGELQETLFSGEKAAGSYTMTWNASNTESGVYILRARFGNAIQTQKLVLVK